MHFKEDSEWESGTVEEEDIFFIKSCYLSVTMLFFHVLWVKEEFRLMVARLCDSEFCFSSVCFVKWAVTAKSNMIRKV